MLHLSSPDSANRADLDVHRLRDLGLHGASADAPRTAHDPRRRAPTHHVPQLFQVRVYFAEKIS